MQPKFGFLTKQVCPPAQNFGFFKALVWKFETLYVGTKCFTIFGFGQPPTLFQLKYFDDTKVHQNIGFTWTPPPLVVQTAIAVDCQKSTSYQ